MRIETTKYYDEFLRYFDLAKRQQDLCNVCNNEPYGMISHKDSNLDDNLMENVELYDVVERKYAGFSQIINDCFYGWTEDHPYWKKMEAGVATRQRETVAKDWTGKQDVFSLPEWLYVFILHRVTGSAINYAQKPSGYHNTILFNLHQCDTIEEMVQLMKWYPVTFYTSVGYQFPAFPKPVGDYRKGGDYYLGEFAPRLARDLADHLTMGPPKDLREIGEFMLKWNEDNGLRRYQFQYAAVVADVADWFPQYVNRESMFYYGTNAVECISYLATPAKKMKKELFLDAVMTKIYDDTGSVPYNAEDVCCDFIRYVENYVRPGPDYDHLDYDTLWSSCGIKDHPYGRQKYMLDLGLVETFNGMKYHPSDDFILKKNNMTAEEYQHNVLNIVSR
ncbi:hypothetical protein OAF54_03035 [bacterium]|nr:hypothetical protein [bacterium]